MKRYYPLRGFASKKLTLYLSTIDRRDLANEQRKVHSAAGSFDHLILHIENSLFRGRLVF